MRFDLMGIIFMVIAIVAGNYGGAYIASFIGMTGGLIGAFIVGAVVYVVFCLLTGTKMDLMQGGIFAVCVYVSGLAVAWISSTTGWGGGIIGLLLNAIVLATIWGYFGKSKSPVEIKGK